MTDEKTSANAMWGGRFDEAPAAIMERFNASIGFDQRLWREDIAGSRAHATMLADQGILTPEDRDQILTGLDQVAAEIEAGTMVWSEALEDIHMNIEARLRDLIGPAAGRLHTGRSRNDQVATDFRLWVRGALDRLAEGVTRWQETLVSLAAAHSGTIMPGFTHLQPATPVTFGHHLLAYVEMAERDRGRLIDARARLNESPLGAAALAGTSYPIDRAATASALGFARPMRNSLDAVSSRDFALEALSAAAMTAITLSRFAEEIVIFSTPGFGFLSCSDQFSTGSSIMPQKRNPDAAELLRGKTGRVAGAFQSLLITLKGLPLAYSKDMQEDKEPVFDALDTVEDCLGIAAGMTAGLTVHGQAMTAAAGRGHTTAVDLADWLVQSLGLPFREAHHVVGRLVALADQRGVTLAGLSDDDLRDGHPQLGPEVRAVLTVEASVAARTHEGGTAPETVAQAVTAWQARLSERTA